MITTRFELTDEQWLTRLATHHNAEIPHLEILDAYYEGEQPLSYMHPELLRRLDDRVRQVVVNWPELVVDSLDERLDVMGFKLGAQEEADRDLWQIWQANRLDLHAQQARVDALVTGRAFAIVGTNEDDPRTPLVMVESPLEVYVELDPRTRRVRAALKRWRDEDTIGLGPTHATLYLPDETIWYTSDTDEGAAWREEQRDRHGLGVVPVVPLLNRPRTRRRPHEGAAAGAFGALQRDPAVGRGLQDLHRHDGQRGVSRDAPAVRARVRQRRLRGRQRTRAHPVGSRRGGVVGQPEKPAGCIGTAQAPWRASTATCTTAPAA